MPRGLHHGIEKEDIWVLYAELLLLTSWMDVPLGHAPLLL
jgi:hypothetical protein